MKGRPTRKDKSIPPPGLKVDDLVEKFNTESDRAAGVLAAAYLDAFLEDILRGVLLPGSRTDEMFEGQGPLRSFGSRIALAHALGVSTDEVSREMDLIRKIRNHFAHNLWEAQFDAQPVSQWCAELRLMDNIMDKDGNIGKPNSSPRERYLLSVGVCVLRLVTSPKVAQALREQTVALNDTPNGEQS